MIWPSLTVCCWVKTKHFGFYDCKLFNKLTNEVTFRYFTRFRLKTASFFLDLYLLISSFGIYEKIFYFAGPVV